MSRFGMDRFGAAVWGNVRPLWILIVLIVIFFISALLWAPDDPERAAYTLEEEEAQYLRVVNQRLQHAAVSRDSFVAFVVGKYGIPKGYIFDGEKSFVKENPK